MAVLRGQISLTTEWGQPNGDNRINAIAILCFIRLSSIRLSFIGMRLVLNGVKAILQS